MKKVIVRAPVRADLAGGTLDLWPLYLFHPGARTVNVAVSFYAESEVAETGDSTIEVHLTDQQYKQTYESLHDLGADPKAALIHRALEHFHLTGIRITTRTDAPRGSGLGGSSALTITLVRALSEIAGEPIEGVDLINLVRDLETRLLGVPAGIQDYYPPVFGGLATLHLNAGAPAHHTIGLPLQELASRMLLYYTGIAHFSGTNNWELYKRQIEGKKRVQKGLAKIAETSIEMERALESGNFEAAGRALAKEWENRKALIEGISTPEIDAAIEAATNAGAWGGKVCGAGGGGCIVFLAAPEKREDVARALATQPGRLLDVAPVAHGMAIERESEGIVSPASRGRMIVRRTTSTVEQLYVYGGEGGDYQPFLLAEGVITHSEGRSGVHQSALYSYVAPIQPADGKVLWHRATPIDPEKLDIRAVPDPAHGINVAVSPEALVQSAAQSEDAFRQFVEETERLRIYSNPSFGLYSETGETRAAFIERCLQDAKRQLSERSERLESTFRRRIDQLKERASREQREAEKDETSSEESRQEVGVAWGQALYNITSGRPAAVTEGAQTVRQVDYMENIAQIQRAWEKELETLRDDLTSKARAVEEIEIVPTAKNIEVTKCLILWATALP
jgi:D-glycero-alpha-D-manno-heptose-7-phosphate kinase